MTDPAEFVYARLEGLSLRAETLRTIASAMRTQDLPDVAYYIEDTASTMLREVEAMRHIVNDYDAMKRATKGPTRRVSYSRAACTLHGVVCALTAIWFDHSDYLEEWKWPGSRGSR